MLQQAFQGQPKLSVKVHRTCNRLPSRTNKLLRLYLKDIKLNEVKLLSTLNAFRPEMQLFIQLRWLVWNRLTDGETGSLVDMFSVTLWSHENKE